MRYDYKTVIDDLNQCVSPVDQNGKKVWCPARPINYKFETWGYRLKSAWLALTGKADLITWEETCK